MCISAWISTHLCKVHLLTFSLFPFPFTASLPVHTSTWMHVCFCARVCVCVRARIRQVSPSESDHHRKLPPLLAWWLLKCCETLLPWFPGTPSRVERTGAASLHSLPLSVCMCMRLRESPSLITALIDFHLTRLFVRDVPLKCAERHVSHLSVYTVHL